jgi:quercetin dioxygenase-like cupin family protein
MRKRPLRAFAGHSTPEDLTQKTLSLGGIYSPMPRVNLALSAAKPKRLTTSIHLQRRKTMKKLSLLMALCFFSLASVVAAEKALVISHSDDALQWGPCPDFIPKGCQIAVLQGDPAKQNLDIFFKVPGGFHIPYHKHTSQERMVLVSGTLDVTYDDHERATINTGEYAYGPAQLPHTAYCHEGDDCVLYIGFVAPLDAIPLKQQVAQLLSEQIR